MPSMACPSCRKSLNIPDKLPANSTIRCPGCQGKFRPKGQPPVVDKTQPAVAEEKKSPGEIMRFARNSESPPPPRPLPRNQDEDDRPIKKRRKRRSDNRKVVLLSVGIIVAGLLVGLSIVVAVLVTRSPANSSATTPATTTLTTFLSPSSPKAAWETFRPEGGHCSVDMPGKPSFIPMQADFGKALEGKQYVLPRGDNQPLKYVILYFEHPVETLTVDDRIRLVREDVQRQPGLRVIDQTTVDRDGLLGREVLVEDDKHMLSIKRLIQERRKDGSATVYVLSATGMGISRTTPDVVRFFDSFKVDARK